VCARVNDNFHTWWTLNLTLSTSRLYVRVQGHRSFLFATRESEIGKTSDGALWAQITTSS